MQMTCEQDEKHVPTPLSSWTRDRLVQWIEDHGDAEARTRFVENAMDRSAKKLSKQQVLDLCWESMERNS